MSARQSMICPGCGAQRAAASAADQGWTEHTCRKCPPIPSADHPHPLAVAFAWWPDYPEAQPDARPVYTATCGCGWSAAAGSERHAWWAAWDHAGLLDAWAARPLLDRPAPTPDPETAAGCTGRSKAPASPASPCAPSWPAATTAAAAGAIPAEESCPPGPDRPNCAPAPATQNPRASPTPASTAAQPSATSAAVPPGARPAKPADRPTRKPRCSNPGPQGSGRIEGQTSLLPR